MMKVFNRVIGGLFLAVACSANAGAYKIIEISAQGTGKTESSAVEDALVSAVSQHQGVDISRQQIRAMMAQSKNGETTVENEFSGVTGIRSEGRVDSYRIIDSQCVSVNRCEANVVARFKVYDAPGQAQENRRRIAVSVFDGPNGQAVTDAFQQGLVSSRRFAVLDRAHDTEYQQEKAMLLSGDVHADERLRLGQVLGIDYLVVGEVVRKEADNINPLTGEMTGEATFGLLRYKVIQIATRQVKQQIEVPLTKTEGEIVVDHAVRSVIEGIYPIRVVKQTGNTLLLNAGKGYLSEGDVYHVYAQGEKLRDPYTGESLGREEIKLGTATITDVKPKYASATFSRSGDTTEVLSPSLLRHAGTADDSSVESSDALPIGESGGVIIP